MGDTKQALFEQASCSYARALSDSCQEYITRRARRSRAYNSTKERIQLMVAMRRSEYVATRKIECYIGVLKSNTSKQTREGMLKGCEKMAVSTAHLEILYP